MVPLALLPNIGLPELIVILLILLLLFGHRLPGVGRALGRSVGEFKTGLKEGEAEAAKAEAAAKDAAAKEEAKSEKKPYTN